MHLTNAIELPDGTWIRGRGLRDPAPDDTPGYGLYLGSRRLRRRHDAALTWCHDWIEWPDFLLPRDRAAAVRQIGKLHEEAQAGRAEVACGGGVGRTGTVIACLAVLSGLPPEEAVAWTRANYNKRAVETPWQRRWVGNYRK